MLEKIWNAPTKTSVFHKNFLAGKFYTSLQRLKLSARKLLQTEN